MTGVFEIWHKTPKEEVDFDPEGMPILPEKDEDFHVRHVKNVETPYEVMEYLLDVWEELDFCEEIVIRCELPT